MKFFKENEPLSAFTHFVGALLSIAGLTLMVVFAARDGGAAHVVGFTIFGASLIILYSTSSLYHFIPQKTKLKNIFHRLDHVMIFFLIAGTYTPILLLMPQRGWGWSMFGIIWGFAAIGTLFKVCGVRIPGWFSTMLYILMGWFVLIAFHPLTQWLSTDALEWLFFGGILYTTGCIFLALDKYVPRTRWFGMHEVFHLFVMGGSFSHFWFTFRHLL